MIVLSFDPSYRGMGVFIYSLDGHSLFDEAAVGKEFRVKHPHPNVWFATLTCTKVKSRSFPGYLVEAEYAKSRIRRLLACVLDNSVRIISEIPPPNGRFSPALFLLDGLLISELLSDPRIERVFLVPPNAINSYFGRRSVDKSEIAAKASEEVGVRLNHDEASAYFLYKIVRDKLEDKFENKIYEYCFDKVRLL